MGALRRPEDEACLAEFHRSDSLSAKVWSIRTFALVNQVRDTLVLVSNIDILLVYLRSCFFRDESCRNYTRVDAASIEH